MKKNFLKKALAVLCATTMLNTVAFAAPTRAHKVPVINDTNKAPAARDAHKAPATHDANKAPAARNTDDASTTVDSYNVHKDDTLWKISRKYGVSLDEVISANPQFADPDLIYPGETVHVPLHHKNNQHHDEIGASMADSGDGSIKTDHAKEGSKADVKSVASAHEYENKVAQIVNAERAKHGLAPLTLSPTVSNVARVKSEDMKDHNYFSHQSPTYGSPFEMMKEFGVKYKTAGENIAKGQKTPEAVMSAWMNSEGHRKNILSPNFKEIGVGYVTGSSGTTYWTQQFIAS